MVQKRRYVDSNSAEMDPNLCPFYVYQHPWAYSKEPAYQCRRRKTHGFDPWVGTIPRRKAWQPTAVFLPGESHGQKSLVGYSPWGRKESDTTEATLV